MIELNDDELTTLLVCIEQLYDQQDWEEGEMDYYFGIHEADFKKLAKKLYDSIQDPDNKVGRYEW